MSARGLGCDASLRLGGTYEIPSLENSSEASAGRLGAWFRMDPAIRQSITIVNQRILRTAVITMPTA